MEAKKDNVAQLIGALSPDVEKQLGITRKNVQRGVFVTSVFTGVCGLLAGPAGFAVGGIIGGIYSWKTSEKFKPLPHILMEMTLAQWDELFQSIMAVLGGLVWAVINVITQKDFH